MRIFWYQGGLHIEPESDVEAEAMLVLLSAIHYDAPKKAGGEPPQGGSAHASEIMPNEDVK